MVIENEQVVGGISVNSGSSNSDKREVQIVTVSRRVALVRRDDRARSTDENGDAFSPDGNRKGRRRDGQQNSRDQNGH
jgi:hypothetical protein